MGKHGPCYHCGVTSTPLWRNGPPEKPILCNACGSRWRTKGSLVNYTPLHSRAEPDEYEAYKIPRANIISIKPKEPKVVLKRKQNNEKSVFKKISPSYNSGLVKIMENDMSNRSSSGSVVSNGSESFVQYGSVDVSNLTGPAQSVVWDQTVPLRKRTCIDRPNQSQVEKLTKDLYTILHEQQYSLFSGSSDEDLLFDSELPMVSVEIGHGSVLIRHPSSIAQEEESEASSISVENIHNSPTFCSHVNKVVIENTEKPFGFGMQRDNLYNGDKDEHEMQLILEGHNSPLCPIDLKEIINYEVFASHVSNEEQKQLLQLLLDFDIATLPFSLESMFTSPEFEEDLLSFQKLLSEGVLDLSFSGVKAKECEKLKMLALTGFTKSAWVERYSILKDKEDEGSKNGFGSRERAKLLAYGSSTNAKKSRDSHFRIGSGTKTMMNKSPSFNNFLENSCSLFTPRSLFPMVDTFQFMAENSDEDILLDVPRNNSFPEAELFYQNSPSSSSVYPRLADPSKAF